MDFQALQGEVFRRFEESSASPVWASLADVKESLNKGLRELADVTEYYEVSDTINLTQSQYVYDLTDGSNGLSPTILSVKAVFNDQTNRWLRPTTVRDLDRAYQKWEEATGQPDMYALRGLWWLQLDRAVTSTAGTITVYYTALPTDLSGNSDTPAFPQEFHLALVDFAVYDLLCQDRDNDKAQYWYGRYKGREEQLKRYVDQRLAIPRVGVLGK